MVPRHMGPFGGGGASLGPSQMPETPWTLGSHNGVKVGVPPQGTWAPPDAWVPTLPSPPPALSPAAEAPESSKKRVLNPDPEVFCLQVSPGGKFGVPGGQFGVPWVSWGSRVRGGNLGRTGVQFGGPREKFRVPWVSWGWWRATEGPRRRLGALGGIFGGPGEKFGVPWASWGLREGIWGFLWAAGGPRGCLGIPGSSLGVQGSN